MCAARDALSVIGHQAISLQVPRCPTRLAPVNKETRGNRQSLNPLASVCCDSVSISIPAAGSGPHSESVCQYVTGHANTGRQETNKKRVVAGAGAGYLEYCKLSQMLPVAVQQT